MAKESLMEPIDMHELLERGPQSKADELRIELYEKVNALGIGAQGLGGLTTVLDVKLKLYPTHAASKPVAMIPNCAATRHAHFVLDGSGPAVLEPPSLEQWPKVTWTAGSGSRRVNLDTLTRDEVASWKPGETLLLNGKMLTGRDAAHKRIADLFASGAGPAARRRFHEPRRSTTSVPVDPVRDEVVGPAGPTTATRMDKFTDMMLEKTGLHRMVGKSERGPGRDRVDPQAPGGVPDGRGRRGLPRVESDPRVTRRRVRRPRHGSDLRIRREGHAGHRGRRCARARRCTTPRRRNGRRKSARSTYRCAWPEASMAEVDTLRRFVFERYPFRGQLVHLGPAWQAMMEHHDYPPSVRDTLGEAVAATALLSSTLKYNGLLSLQLRGEGPMHLMLVECTDGLAMRAVARFREPPDTRDLRVLSGDGTLTVTIENDGRRPIATRASCRSSAPSMCDCLREYFESSEQLPTRLWLHADGTNVSGLLLQRLPVTSKPAAVLESGAGRACPRTKSKTRGVACSSSRTRSPARNSAQLDDQKLLRRLFAEDDVRMFESAPVFFRCRCSRERVENMLQVARPAPKSTRSSRNSARSKCAANSAAVRTGSTPSTARRCLPGLVPPRPACTAGHGGGGPCDQPQRTGPCQRLRPAHTLQQKQSPGLNCRGRGSGVCPCLVPARSQAVFEPYWSKNKNILIFEPCLYSIWP